MERDDEGPPRISKRLVRTRPQRKPFLTVIHPEDEEYDVGSIVDSRKVRGKVEDFVDWVGYGVNERQWEPEKHLQNALDLIWKFHQMNPDKVRGKMYMKAMKSKTRRR